MTGTPRFRVHFVCTVNLCRSVLAEGLTSRAIGDRLGPLSDRFHIGSAGVQATPGQPMHPYVRDILRARGAEIGGFASRRLTVPLIAGADLVLTATARQRDWAISMEPAALLRTFTMAEFARLAGAAAGPYPDDLVARARAIVAAAQGMRGRMPYVDSASEDVPDPRPTRAAFEACAARVAVATTAVVEALCPVPVGPEPLRVEPCRVPV